MTGLNVVWRLSWPGNIVLVIGHVFHAQVHCAKRLFGKNKALILKGKQRVVKALRANFGCAQILLSDTVPIRLHPYSAIAFTHSK